MHKKAIRIGFDKVFGKYPRAISDTYVSKNRKPMQRIMNKDDYNFNFSLLTDYERFMFDIIMDKLVPYKNEKHDDFEPPF